MELYEVKYQIYSIIAGYAFLTSNMVRTHSPEDARRLVYNKILRNKNKVKAKFLYVRKVTNVS